MQSIPSSYFSGDASHQSSAQWGPSHYREAPPPPPVPQVRPMEAIRFAFALLREHPATVLLAGLFTIIPVIGPMALNGWRAEMHQRLRLRDPRPLVPLTFNDLVARLPQGMPVYLTRLVLQVVLGTVGTFVGCVMGAGGFVLAVFVSLGGGRGADFLPVYLLWTVGTVLVIALMALFLPWMNGALTRVELTEDLGQALRLDELRDYFRRTWGDTIVAIVPFALVAVALVLAGLVCFLVGAYFAVILLQVASTHLRWQLYELYLWRGGSEVPVKLQQRLLQA